MQLPPCEARSKHTPTAPRKTQHGQVTHTNQTKLPLEVLVTGRQKKGSSTSVLSNSLSFLSVLTLSLSRFDSLSRFSLFRSLSRSSLKVQILTLLSLFFLCSCVFLSCCLSLSSLSRCCSVFGLPKSLLLSQPPDFPFFFIPSLSHVLLSPFSFLFQFFASLAHSLSSSSTLFCFCFCFYLVSSFAFFPLVTLHSLFFPLLPPRASFPVILSSSAILQTSLSSSPSLSCVLPSPCPLTQSLTLAFFSLLLSLGFLSCSLAQHLPSCPSSVSFPNSFFSRFVLSHTRDPLCSFLLVLTPSPSLILGFTLSEPSKEQSLSISLPLLPLFSVS